jgi:two-component system cell cycle sensor histidine kinase/response regulator CckA
MAQSPINILIVDDDCASRKLLGATLDSEGYDTFQASDGVEALSLLETEPIDAVISDVFMPNMDGFRLCAEVRGSKRCGEVPFIFYTSTYTESRDQKLAMELGADRFLRKPASPALVTQTIKELLAERKTSKSRPVLPVEESDVMKQYSQTLVRKLAKRNGELSVITEALRLSEARLRAIFDAEPDCVHVVGRDGRTIEINDAGLKMLEAGSLEEVGNRPMAEMVAGEKKCVEFEIEGLRGSRRWLEMHSAPLRDGEGEIMALLGIARDNTARRELQAQFVQAQKMEVVGQLASGVAHDFNNMLAIIMGYSEIAMNDLGSGSNTHGCLKTIFHTAERAASLTRQLLIFSRKETARPQVLDLSELIAGIDPMLRRLIGDNVKLVTQPEPEIGRVRADPGQIEQVLMNLTVNARDAMPNGGTITIATSRASIGKAGIPGSQIEAGDYVVFSVADNGSGMTDEVKAKMFEAFFTTKPAGKGTGLGLATCQSIVSRWQGHITVDSVLGAGTIFKVYLPEAARDAGPVASSEQSGALPRGIETILLVEDEPGVRDLAAAVLQKQGYVVLQAGNGQEALRVVREEPGRQIDLVLTDMVMPEMGGRMMAEWLLATNPEIKILFTSGYTECDGNGALDDEIEFLPKPYTPSTLVRKVRQVIDAGSQTLRGGNADADVSAKLSEKGARKCTFPDNSRVTAGASPASH